MFTNTKLTNSLSVYLNLCDKKTYLSAYYSHISLCDKRKTKSTAIVSSYFSSFYLTSWQHVREKVIKRLTRL